MLMLMLISRKVANPAEDAKKQVLAAKNNKLGKQAEFEFLKK